MCKISCAFKLDDLIEYFSFNFSFARLQVHEKSQKRIKSGSLLNFTKKKMEKLFKIEIIFICYPFSNHLKLPGDKAKECYCYFWAEH